MKITVVGTGYVGLVAGVCFADVGHNVTCVDKDDKKINQLNEGIIPIYEPGLDDVLKSARTRLTFTTDIVTAIKNNKVIFIAVGTPETNTGQADLGPTMAVVDAICKNANEDKIVVLKSTVPIGTAVELTEYTANNSSHRIEIVNNPEFLKEGAAVDDFLRPDRVVIGASSDSAKQLMKELYEPFLKNGHPIYFMDNASAEMTKYAANAFLSVKISFINELAQLADKVGADIAQVRKGFTSDSRICPAFFYPGVGYGGSCFPKDVVALVKTGEEQGLRMDVVQAADRVNDRQKLLLFDLAKKEFGDLKGKTIAVWGLSFKPNTDDVREAPALALIEQLVNAGANVQAYDPAAMTTARAESCIEFKTMDSALDAATGANALMLVTEWNEFKNPEFGRLREVMKEKVIFDGRNVYDPQKVSDLGFKYFCVGRKNTYT